MDEPQVTAEEPASVLLVDDTPDDRALAAHALRKAMPRVTIGEAGTREEFDHQLQAGSWDVVITDYQLQWSNGLEVLQQVARTLPDVPVIMFTGSGNEELAVEALKRGVFDYLVKSPRHYGRIPVSVLAALRHRQQRLSIRAMRSDIGRWRALEQAMAAASPDLVWIAGADGRLLFVNRNFEAFTGVSQAELGSLDWTRLVASQDVDLVAQRWAEAANASGSMSAEVRMRSASGQLRWMALRAVPFAAGEQRQWLALATDVEERKQAEQKLEATAADLREADRQKNQFLATLAHELRNPMAPIRYAAALIRPEAPPELLVKVRDTIERQSGHMSRLLDDLLDMSRITRDVIELDRKPVDVAHIVQEVIDNVRPQASLKRQELSLTLQSGPAWVMADATRVAQIISNLLGNAIKYTQSGGRIHVALDSRDGWVNASVSDNGIGLSPEMMPKLFRLFAQLHPDLDVSAGGLGIGLAVSQRLAQLHGGELTATSPGLGKGTGFTLRLPQLQAPTKAARPALAVLPAPRALKILVVDDNSDAAQILADVLGAHGHLVEQAYDAAGAIEKAAALAPDAVVLDLGLPDASGVQVARRLRAAPATAETLVVAVTGWGQDEDRRRTRDAGIDYHLVKPVEPTHLLNLLHASRSRRRSDPH